MKNLTQILLIVSSILAATSLIHAQTAGTSTLSKHRPEIQKVIKTDEKGILRGIDFGTPSAKLKELESGQYVADGKDFVIYKVALNEKEYAEVIYYLDAEKKVKGFGVEFIISESDYQLEENIVIDFQQYFTERFGKFKVNAKNDEVWDAGTYTVEMGDSSEGGNVLEIEIEIFPKNLVKK